MTSKSISEQLEEIASAEDFAYSSAELTDAWTSFGLGKESVEPILRFMEEHPGLDYGMPGPLVHFIEEFYLKGYEERLIESVGRKPNMQTVWMLDRVLNGTEDSAKGNTLVRVMRQAADNPKADQQTLESIRGFLERLKSVRRGKHHDSPPDTYEEHSAGPQAARAQHRQEDSPAGAARLDAFAGPKRLSARRRKRSLHS